MHTPAALIVVLAPSVYVEEERLFKFPLLAFSHMDAFGAPGFDTRTSGFEGISALYGKKANYLKLLRDEYDVVTSSERMGQRNRPPRERIKETVRQLSRFSFEELTELAKALMEGAAPFEEHETHDDKDALPADASEHPSSSS